MTANRPAKLPFQFPLVEWSFQRGLIDIATFINAMLSWRGTVQIGVGQTSVAVTHGVVDANGVPAAPARVILTARTDPQQRYWVSSITSTQFTVTVGAAIAGTAVNFDFSAYLND
ncbi:MAG: hypothetical protein ACYDB4_19370 [Candidatus Dormibacteraceae bacterium]